MTFSVDGSQRNRLPFNSVLSLCPVRGPFPGTGLTGQALSTPRRSSGILENPPSSASSPLLGGPGPVKLSVVILLRSGSEKPQRERVSMERCTGGPSEEGTSALLLKLDPKERFRRTAIRESLHGQARGRRPGEEGLNEGSEEPTLGALRWMSPALVPPRRSRAVKHPVSSPGSRRDRSALFGDDSEESPPWKALAGIRPRSPLRGAATGALSLRPAPGMTLRGGLTKKTVSVRLGKEREKRAYRGLSLIRNPYILPAGVSRRAGADPLLSFHPSRVLTLPAMTGHAPYLLPCT
jgi:hypothetical protein